MPTLNVLVTMPFPDPLIERLRRVSPTLTVTRVEGKTADYSSADIVYTGMPAPGLERSPRLRWVQVHMAGVDALAAHPL